MGEINQLLWKTLRSVTVNDDKDVIMFETVGGERYAMQHHQDCCESVSVEDINGDLSDLIGLPIVIAEESCSDGMPEGVPSDSCYDDSHTWTFYKLATQRGYVDIRWLGQSNGYYSESVDVDRVS